MAPRTGWRCLLVALCLAPAARAADYVPLFDGKSTAGWTVDGPREAKGTPVWQVKDGTIVASGKAFGFLRYSDREFSDFSFRVEYRMEPPANAHDERANSGLGIRTCVYDPRRTTATRPSMAAYEIQLMDDADKTTPDEHSTASLYRYVAARAVAHKPAPAWNTVEVTCVGPRVRVTMNGTAVQDADQTAHEAIKFKPLKGYVCLQSHSKQVEFRKVELQDLSPPAAVKEHP